MIAGPWVDFDVVIDLTPLTVLTGLSSAGRSTTIQALQMLAEWRECFPPPGTGRAASHGSSR